MALVVLGCLTGIILMLLMADITLMLMVVERTLTLLMVDMDMDITLIPLTVDKILMDITLTLLMADKILMPLMADKIPMLTLKPMAEPFILSHPLEERKHRRCSVTLTMIWRKTEMGRIKRWVLMVRKALGMVWDAIPLMSCNRCNHSLWGHYTVYLRL
jgi:hypothetical protein